MVLSSRNFHFFAPIPWIGVVLREASLCIFALVNINPVLKDLKVSLEFSSARHGLPMLKREQTSLMFHESI